MIIDNLKKHNITIPDAPEPVGSYVAFKFVGKLLYISGQLPIGNNGKIIKGKIGKDLSIADGQEAARLCTINILAQVKKAVEGNLDKVKNCVKITGFVNSTDDFKDQPKIINAASEMLTNVFGENGKHTRAAVSSNSLPLGIAVEIDAIFEIS
jgi:enamine deaminase RidA (YjgF/YER057c/UK114 family)